MDSKLLLIGTGRMGQEYAHVLNDLKIPFTAVGRGIKSAEVFMDKTGIKPETGGIELWLSNKNFVPDMAIIAVKVVDLSKVCKIVLNAGVKKILLEKPGALYRSDIEDLKKLADQNEAEVFIAYNRRFYSSVREAARIISEDGGVLSFNFEFTEWSDKVEAFDTDDLEKERWFLSNSSHVADLAFYFGGRPVKMECNVSGSLPWHKNGSSFSGSGESISGALFSYVANWKAPGRWGLEILSANNRVVLRPLEQLRLQKKGTLEALPVIIEDDLDKKFKPGLYRMVNNFVQGPAKDLCTLDEQVSVFDDYCRIANYK